ncbi:class I adenylate-forming enzyme family protein [Amycolatopsis sp. NPDC059657]|uniref:class I adenylate-forming enzyme family protein n=1 Tax=Amycolatopsis sp. NPDC059657 TaxID=3346899 RepID=UPI00366A5E69
MSWTSSAGIVLPDLVPSSLRRRWVSKGFCPGRDLYSLFEVQVRCRPDQEAVVDEGGSLTYAELGREVRVLAVTLSSAGLFSQDIIGIQVRNGRLAVIAELAVAAVGAVALPIPSGRDQAEAILLLGRARASAALVDDASPISAAQHHLPRLRDVFVLPLEAGRTSTNWVSYRVDPESPARIVVSSGAAGDPKMVAYSHNAIAGGLANHLRGLHVAPEGIRDLLLVPLASANGSFGATVTLACFGGTLILPREFDAAVALRMAGAHRATHVFGEPAMLGRMAELVPRLLSFPAMEAVVSSGDFIPQSTVNACRRAFGADVISVYASSGGVHCQTRGPHHSAGLPDPAVAEIRIVDGEVLVRGPVSPLCYVATPGLDARYRTLDGWLRTGDAGHLAPDGELHLLGRIDRAQHAGKALRPADIERELGTHPAVAEVACVTLPDSGSRERLCACVVPRPGHALPTLADFTAFLFEQRGLPLHELPGHLLLVSELPRTNTGRVCRATLSQLIAQRGLAVHGHE